VKYSILKFKRNEKHTMRDLEKLRGFLADKYKENVLFHNHLSDGYNYSYPKLQYKLITNMLSVMGIGEEVIEINKKRFVTPYLPLNEKNYAKYLKREYTLEQAITNNILEVLKGLGIWLDKEDKIYVSQNLEIRSRDLKNVNMIAFIGSFSVNMKFPDYFSIGKRKSIGFGTFIKNNF